MATSQNRQPRLSFPIKFIDKVRPDFTRYDLSQNSYYLQGDLPQHARPSFADMSKLKPDAPGTVIIMGKPIATPRYTANYMKPYRFSGVLHPTAPLPSVLEPLLQWANEKILASELPSAPTFNQALVNFYDCGLHYIGRHSDDETQLVARSPIFSASFGQERVFRIRRKGTSGTGEIVKDIPMKDGSFIVMCGDMQKEFTHEIPKVAGAKGEALGGRINVTFRVFK